MAVGDGGVISLVASTSGAELDGMLGPMGPICGACTASSVRTLFAPALSCAAVALCSSAGSNSVEVCVLISGASEASAKHSQSCVQAHRHFCCMSLHQRHSPVASSAGVSSKTGLNSRSSDPTCDGLVYTPCKTRRQCQHITAQM